MFAVVELILMQRAGKCRNVAAYAALTAVDTNVERVFFFKFVQVLCLFKLFDAIRACRKLKRFFKRRNFKRVLSVRKCELSYVAVVAVFLRIKIAVNEIFGFSAITTDKLRSLSVAIVFFFASADKVNVVKALVEFKSETESRKSETVICYVECKSYAVVRT